MSITILSLNLGHGRGRASSQLRLDADVIHANLVEAVGLVRRHGADVLAAQEVDGPSWWSGRFDHAQVLADGLQMEVLHGHHVDQWGLRYGAALFSSKLASPLSHRFKARGPTPPKGMVVASTEVDGRSVDVVSLHLDFALPRNRRRQLDEVHGVLEARGRPFIVAGDFNMEPAGVERFANRLGAACCSPGITFARTQGRLDHVLTSRELKVVTAEVLPDKVSDHLAVRAEVTWAS